MIFDLQSVKIETNVHITKLHCNNTFALATKLIVPLQYLTILLGYESIAHESEGRMSY